MPSLSPYAKNYHSQFGEDGITEEIIRRLGWSKHDKNRWACEFGAWDGCHLSNTKFLINSGWNGVYIEGDTERFEALVKEAAIFKNIIPINAMVAQHRNQENCLDNLLARTPIPKDFELLSIDIDSYDLDVWASLMYYTPIVIIIETNDTEGPFKLWTHDNMDKTIGHQVGNSFAAIQNFAVEKGYTLVAHTGNSFYVRNDHVEKIGISQACIDNPHFLFKLGYHD